jgi:uncharacterized membrane protein YfcA
MNPALIAAGFAIGALTGLTGVGAAALTTPFLILFVGVAPIRAVGTDFVFSAATKLLGTHRHWRQGTVDWRVVLRLACASIPGLLVGTLLIHSLGHSHAADRVLTRTLGVAIVLTGASLGFQCLRPARPDALHTRRTWPWWRVLPLAFVLGILVGVTSVGSGSLFFLLLSLAVAIPLPCVVGSDVAHAAILTGAGAILSLGAHTADPLLTLNLLLGSLPGVWVGSSLTARLPKRVLQGFLSVVLLASGVRYAL